MASLTGIEALRFLSDHDKKRLKDAVMHSLPPTYNFEVAKTIRRVHEAQAKRICLQFPEGLLCWAEPIALILEEFSLSAEDVCILGDVTYGACCVDDIKARALGCDFLVHYAHSCLIPIDAVKIPCLYVFVEICFDTEYLVRTLKALLPASITNHEHTHDACPPNEDSKLQVDEVSERMARKVVEPKSDRTLRGAEAAVFVATASNKLPDLDAAIDSGPQSDGRDGNKSSSQDDFTLETRNIALLGSIQFSGVIHAAAQLLRQAWPADNVFVPQVAPLTPGETLGCTSPKLPVNTHFCIFVADGRFHLESAMIQNPHVRFYRFDPFLKKLFIEAYCNDQMLLNRQEAITQARQCRRIILILSTLGRQGSVGLLEYIEARLKVAGKEFVSVSVSEIMPTTLSALAGSHLTSEVAFIQVGCPRLSIDWGHQLGFSVLSPYEAYVAFGQPVTTAVSIPCRCEASGGTGQLDRSDYPMDYFATRGGPWTNYGRGTHRNGTMAGNETAAEAAQSAKDRLREKWLRRKMEINNASDPSTVGRG